MKEAERAVTHFPCLASWSTMTLTDLRLAPLSSQEPESLRMLLKWCLQGNAGLLAAMQARGGNNER